MQISAEDDPIILSINRITNHGFIYIDFSEDLIVPPIWAGILGLPSTSPVKYNNTEGTDMQSWAMDEVSTLKNGQGSAKPPGFEP